MIMSTWLQPRFPKTKRLRRLLLRLLRTGGVRIHQDAALDRECTDGRYNDCEERDCEYMADGEETVAETVEATPKAAFNATTLAA